MMAVLSELLKMTLARRDVARRAGNKLARKFKKEKTFFTFRVGCFTQILLQINNVDRAILTAKWVP